MPDGISLIDGIVLVVYLLGITGLGFWMARNLRNLSDFFMPRRFGKAMMITHAFGTGTASDQAVSVASATFKGGLSGIWFQWLWLISTPFYWLIAPIMRRLRAVTTADVFELRYDRSVAVLFAVVGLANMCVKIGLMLIGSSVLVDAVTGSAIPTNWAVAIITVMFVVYGAAGGLSAAIVTDFVQGIMTVVFSIMLLPFVLGEVGGMAGVRETITEPEMLSLLAPGKIGLFFIVMMAIQALVGIVGQPFIMGVCSAGRNEFDGRVGFMVGNFVKRLCTIAWTLTGIAAVAWYMRQGVDLSSINPDKVYGNMAREFLPRMAPGLLGVFLASLLAGVMSSCDSFMISGAGLFTENIYKPAVRGKSTSHYMFVARTTAVLVVVGGVVFAYTTDGVINALKIWLKIGPMMGIVFWLGLLWRRASVAGAWAATLTGFGVWFLVTRGFFVGWAQTLPFADAVDLVWIQEGKAPAIYEPWVILFYLTAAAFVGVVVSLLTRRVPDEKLARFYNLTRTPIQENEQPGEPCVLPPGVVPAERRMLLTAFDLEIPAPSRTSVIGFVAGWIGVVALVGGFVAIVRM